MILILTQCFAPQLGGIETLMTGLAEALAAAGEDVAVYADGSSSERAYDRIMHAPYEIERSGGPKPYRRWRKGRAAAKRVAEGGIEGIIADSWKSVEPLPGTLSNTLIVCLAHGMELPSQPSPAK
ncbi:MAG: glycosyltransferase, partial [Pseudomonadota bacterium]